MNVDKIFLDKIWRITLLARGILIATQQKDVSL